MKISCLLALAAVALTARGMTDDDDEPQQRRLNQLGASFGDAADFASTLGQGGSASVAVGMPQGDENADSNPRLLSRVGQWFGDAATSLGDISLGSILASPSQQNEASDEPAVKKLCVRPGADGECEAEDDVEEEVDDRQKVRIDESGCMGRVVQFPTQKNGNMLSVELDENQGEECPALDLVKTTRKHVTFLDDQDNEVAWEDVRKPYPSKNMGKGPRKKILQDIRGWAAAYDDATPLTESDIKAEVFDWSKIDASNVLKINVEDAPEMDVSQAVFQNTGRGGPFERKGVRNYLLDLRALREKDHKETLKKTHHLEKGFDDLYDPETNWFRFKKAEWFAGSGRYSIWRAVSKKIKEVNAPDCPHNNLASADTHRPECQTNFFHDEEFKMKMADRSLEGLTGEVVDHALYPPYSRVSLDHLEGFEGVEGYVTATDGLCYYHWRFNVRGRGSERSDVFYSTREEARDAREAAMDDYDWPPLLDDGFTSDPRFREKPTWRLDADFYKAIRDDGVPDPWDFGFGQDYAEYDNPLYRYHGTPLQNLLANLDSIKDDGLLLKALCDDPATNIPHSRCGEKLWAGATMRNSFAHMRSDMTISRHVKNHLNTYDKWFEVAILALPAAGWKKKFTPHYRFSGFYSKGPVVPVACLRVNLLEGLAGLKKARKWAADGHPRDHPDSCW